MADPKAGFPRGGAVVPTPWTGPSKAVPRLPRVPSPGPPGSLRHNGVGGAAVLTCTPGNTAHPGQALSWGLKLGTPGPRGRETLYLLKGAGPD